MHLGAALRAALAAAEGEQGAASAGEGAGAGAGAEGGANPTAGVEGAAGPGAGAGGHAGPSGDVEMADGRAEGAVTESRAEGQAAAGGAGSEAAQGGTADVAVAGPSASSAPPSAGALEECVGALRVLERLAPDGAVSLGRVVRIVLENKALRVRLGMPEETFQPEPEAGSGEDKAGEGEGEKGAEGEKGTEGEKGEKGEGAQEGGSGAGWAPPAPRVVGRGQDAHGMFWGIVEVRRVCLSNRRCVCADVFVTGCLHVVPWLPAACRLDPLSAIARSTRIP